MDSGRWRSRSGGIWPASPGGSTRGLSTWLCQCLFTPNASDGEGFNQAALLAAQLSKIYGIPLAAEDCVRVRDTPPQTGLRAAERRKNVAGAFHVPFPQRVKSRRVLLIDDVLTTGATANSCARALLDAGAEGVWVATLARVHSRNIDVL